jgi:hypothetical protein
VSRPDDHSAAIDDCYFTCLRAVAGRIVAVLGRDGTLHRPDDVWLFTPHELASHLRGEQRIDPAALRRKREVYEHALRLLPPGP